MKIISFIVCCVVFVACRSTNKQSVSDTLALSDTNLISIDTGKKKASQKETTDTVFHPYKLIDDFVVTDTGYYDFVVGGSVFAVIKKNDRLIDTIDLYFGLQKINNRTYMYQTVKGDGPMPANETTYGHKVAISANPGDYVILSNNQKSLFSKLTPHFNDYFSSPAIINNKIYYWQIEELKSGNHHISASEYDPVTKKTRSHYLFDDYIEVDDSGYFPMPYKENGNIIFIFEKEKKYKFSRDFTLVQ